MALLALVAGAHAWAQEAGSTAPVSDRPAFDEPPPLNLGTPPKPQPDPIEADRKARHERWPTSDMAILEAVRNGLVANRKIRAARFHVQLELWIDSSGHVMRVELVPPTGDAELDATLRNQALGLTLPTVPRDMPMPLKLQIEADPKTTPPTNVPGKTTLLALVAGSPGLARDAGPTAPPSRPTFDEPPPLNLGTPPKPESELESDRKVRDDRRHAYYAVIRNAVFKALAANRKVRFARFDVRLKLWIASSGSVTRAELVTSTGDVDLDATLRDEALGLTLPVAPGDIPKPVNLAIR